MNFRFLWGWQYLLFPTFKLVIWRKCTMADVSALVGGAPFWVSPQKPSVNWWAYRHVVWVVRNSLSCPSAKTECVFISIRVLCWLNLWPWIRQTHRLSNLWVLPVPCQLWSTGVVPLYSCRNSFFEVLKAMSAIFKSVSLYSVFIPWPDKTQWFCWEISPRYKVQCFCVIVLNLREEKCFLYIWKC